MCELVFLVVSVLQIDEDAQVVCTSHYAYARAGKLGTELIVAPRADAFFRTINVEGGDWRMMRGLLGDIGDRYKLAVAFETAGAARGQRVGCLKGRVGVFDLPIALPTLAGTTRGHSQQRPTLKNSPKVEL